MKTPENFSGDTRPAVTEEEAQLAQLIEAAKAAGEAGVYDHSDIPEKGEKSPN